MSPTGKAFWGALAALILAPLAGCGPDAPRAVAEAAAASGSYAGSPSCADCHPEAWQEWHDSHHALAERELDPEVVAAAFGPGHVFTHVSQQSEARLRDGVPELVTQGPDGERRAFPVVRMFGVFPLIQFLVDFGKGRYQVTELAWDPAQAEWFNVYGDEDRFAGEYGHWTGRGMTWNSMCFGCHNTGIEKNYDFASDTFDSTAAERGVGCEACHGPSRDHVIWQEANEDLPGDPHLPDSSREAAFATCGSCHARRHDLSGAFRHGERFMDHFLPAIPDETDVYHSDGQVRDENFEYSSFISSRMYRKGVHCLDCHSPHTGKQLRQGNDVCMHCHQTNAVTPIDPAAHMFHDLDTPGGLCVDCHMPLTTYMARHPRRDHGFTIPDPLLTIEHGIPNACDRCHADKGLEWQVEAVDKWYGERMQRHTRERARAVALARFAEPGGLEPLLSLVAEPDPEYPPLWEAVAMALLPHYFDDARAREAVRGGLSNESPLVRARAARSWGMLVEYGLPGAAEELQPLLEDELRGVRAEAAWPLRDRLAPDHPALLELEGVLEPNVDMPAGTERMGYYLLSRDRIEEALPYLARAMQWDPYSGLLASSLATAQSMAGRPEEAAQTLVRAMGYLPEDPDLAYSLGLIRAELGQLEQAARSLERAVDLAPDNARGWYNLGLARSELGQDEGALAALAEAERRDPVSPDAPFAAATILMRQGLTEEARAAAVRTLQRDPNHRGAIELYNAGG